MARTAKSAETIKKNTIAEMKKLGIYKPEYNNIIDVYASLLERYLLIKSLLSMDAYVARSTVCITEEALRKDVLKYASELGLTPYGLKKINDKSVSGKKESTLAKALKQLE